MPSIDPARWQQLEPLLDEAMDLPPDQRTAFLDRVCGDDEALRADLERLLAADAEASTFLEAPAHDRAADLLDVPFPVASDRTGQRIGDWRILETLGQGGMGAVYLAERADGAFEQRAALKIIRSDLVSRDTFDRFLQERQILARLRHPHIARLLDGGTTEDGRPFLVMEYAEGVPITRYAAEHKLDVPARLRLFQQACEAVHYAHSNLIVHRDLKPSNMLVTGTGEVMLLDFGIAKLISDDPDAALPDKPLLTRTGQVLMTPEYAAPEQVRHDAITLATDIYALGVLLYELLTGTRPYQFNRLSPTEVERVVCEEEPRKPSTAVLQSGEEGLIHLDNERLAERLQGDLDTIVLMALRKEPERRYSSVQHLLDDIARHLNGLPVLACEDTAGYRVRKFVTRHRVGVAAAVLVVLSLVGGLTVALWQANEAAIQRDRAQLEAEKATQVKDFLVNLFETSDPDASRGETITARELLDRGAVQVREDLADQPDVQAELLMTIGTVYTKLGLHAPAVALLDSALAMQRALYARSHPELAATLRAGALLMHEQGQYDAADSLYREALAMYQTLQGEKSPDIAGVINDLGLLQWHRGNLDDAEPLLRQALAMQREVLERGNRDIPTNLNNLGLVLRYKGQNEEARAFYEEALALRREILGDMHVDVAQSYNNLAMLLRSEGQLEEAEAMFREALRIGRQTQGDTHPDVAYYLTNLGSVLADQNKYDEAEPFMREALDLRRQILGENHPVVSQSLMALGGLLQRKGDFRAAEPFMREAIAISETVFGRNNRSTALNIFNLGFLKIYQGDYSEAEPLLREALDLRRTILGDEHPDVLLSMQMLAQLLVMKAASTESPATYYAEATSLYDQALPAMEERFPEDHRIFGYVFYGKGLLLAKQNRPEEALPILEESLRIRLQEHGADDPRTAETEAALGYTKVLLGRYDEAEDHLLKSHPILRDYYGDEHPIVQENREVLQTLQTTRSNIAQARNP